MTKLDKIKSPDQINSNIPNTFKEKSSISTYTYSTEPRVNSGIAGLDVSSQLPKDLNRSAKVARRTSSDSDRINELRY